MSRYRASPAPAVLDCQCELQQHLFAAMLKPRLLLRISRRSRWQASF